MKPYELIEHTADIAIKVRGSDLKELFRNAALAIFDIIAERRTPKSNKQKKIKIRQRADTLEELFVNWLNELLSLAAARELIFSGFRINKLGRGLLEAVATGESSGNYRVNTEVKAATYHELKIEEGKSGWVAEVIFDV